MIPSIASASALALLTSLGAATASLAQTREDYDRLMIVNGNSGQVIYDDGRDDLFCVTRRYVVGYTYYGRANHHRTMRCR